MFSVVDSFDYTVQYDRLLARNRNRFLLCPGIGERSIAISLSVCLPVREHISGTAKPIVTNFLCRSRGRGSVLLWRRCDTGAESDVCECLVAFCDFLASATIRTVPETFCFRVCPSVCESVRPENIVTEYHISKTNKGNFTQFWLQMYIGSRMRWLDFGVKQSKVKVTAATAARRVPASRVCVYALVTNKLTCMLIA